MIAVLIALSLAAQVQPAEVPAKSAPTQKAPTQMAQVPAAPVPTRDDPFPIAPVPPKAGTKTLPLPDVVPPLATLQDPFPAAPPPSVTNPAAASAGQRDKVEKTGDDIVVSATSKGCRVQFADQILSDADLNERAKIWAQGVPVRVIARSTASFDCLKKIAFKLTQMGVSRITFVDPADKPAEPLFPQPKGLLDRSYEVQNNGMRVGSAQQNWELEHHFLSRRASTLILQNKCAEARQLMLEEGDLEGAALVVTICRAN